VTEDALTRFETDGIPISVGETRLTARGRDPLKRTKPCMARSTSSASSTTPRTARAPDCPLEHQACIMRGETPRFPSQLSHK